MACFANTPGGGAIILGVADDGARIGTELDHQWLRHRIRELTEGRLTVEVREGALEGTRLLVPTTREAVEPIRPDAVTRLGRRAHPSGADYIRREVPGADSTQWIASAGPLTRSLRKLWEAAVGLPLEP